MSAAAPKIAGKRAAGPISAAVALLAAAGAYLLPLPGLSPPVWSGPQPQELAKGPAPGQPKGVPPGLIAQPQDWAAFASLFDKLREPIAVAETPAGGGSTTGGEGAPPAQPPDNPIPWHYRGFIREPSRLVALVELPEGQRLIVVGESIPEHGSQGDPIEVLSIEPDHLVVRRPNGKEESLKIEPSTPDSEAARRTLTPSPPLGRR